MRDPNDLLCFNGINGATGEYSIAPMTAEQFCRIITAPAKRTPTEIAHLRDLDIKRRHETEGDFAPEEGVDPKKLSESGWGVIFAMGPDAKVTPPEYEALAPLLKLRREQAGDRYREYVGPTAYRDAQGDTPAESKPDFLRRNGAATFGPVKPAIIPYYLLLVGDAQAIPFDFQYQIDVQFAVGRIHFDTLDEYAAYAQSVVAAETGNLALERRAAVFGVANDGDGPTRVSHDELAVPLAAWAATQPGWKVDTYLKQDATKARLKSLLGDDAPAFLLTASHGMQYPNGDSRQLAQQGALVCQDWPGPGFRGAFSNDFFFGGDDVAADANVFGTIAMHFACFGAGTPQLSDFCPPGTPPTLAPKGFVGHLPQRLLAHPRGGALAVVGHFERAYAYSFHQDQVGSQTEVFNSTIKRLMEGHPIGSALEYFNQRYAEISSELSKQLGEVSRNMTVDQYMLAALWQENNDARNYAVIGDPAVRLMLADDSRPAARPVLEVLPLIPTPAPSTPSTPAPPQPPTGPAQGTVLEYGVFDSVQAAAASLQDAAQKIGAWLTQSFESVTSVRVSTYVSDKMDDVKPTPDGGFSGATLRAVTLASLDGNTRVCVPETDGKLDDALWAIHSDIVQKAMTNRVEMLKAAASAVASLVPGVKPR